MGKILLRFSLATSVKILLNFNSGGKFSPKRKRAVRSYRDGSKSESESSVVYTRVGLGPFEMEHEESPLNITGRFLLD